MRGVLAFHVSDEMGKLANVRNGPPERRRHVRQWQLHIEVGIVVLEYVTAPHIQPPVSTGFALVAMSK